MVKMYLLLEIGSQFWKRLKRKRDLG